MKNWPAFLRESLSKEHIKAQLKPGSQLWRIFIFSLVAAISLGVIYSFFNQYLGGTRAATEPITVTAGASKNQLAINEQFTINVLFSAAENKKVSQLDLRFDYPTGGTNGGVEFVKSAVQSTPVGGSETNYFDTVVLEESTTQGGITKVRVVLSSRKPEAQLANRVIVKIPFKAVSNGQVTFTLDEQNMEIVGPGGENIPTTYNFGTGSQKTAQVTIGQGPTATTVPPTTGPTATAEPTGPTSGPTTGPTTGPTSAVTVAPTTAQPTSVPGGSSCSNSDQCQNGYACMSGKCLPVLCDGQRVCPGGYSCKQGVCFPGTCDNNNPCSNGYNCSNGMCMPAQCRADAPCPPGYSCQDDGTCKQTEQLGQCTENAQCNANGQCVNNNCFCKEGTYNCDRDWADGCEATAPCQGSGTAKILLKVKFNGIGVNVPPVSNTMKVNVTLANKYLKAPLERTVDLRETSKDEKGISIYEGSFDVNNIAFGSDYSIFVKGEQHLQKRICDMNPTEIVDGRYYCTEGKITIKEGENILDFTKIYQLAGDLPVSNAQSGFIDAVDVVFIRSNFGTKAADKLTIGDLNKDGIIDTQDYALAVYALSFKYDEDITAE